MLDGFKRNLLAFEHAGEVAVALGRLLRLFRRPAPVEVEERLGAALGFASVEDFDLSCLEILLDVEKDVRRAGDGRDVPEPFKDADVCVAPFGRRARAPRTPVRGHPFAKFVFLALAGLYRAPVHFRYDARIVHHNWHLLEEIGSKAIYIRSLVALPVPAGIDVDGKTHVRERILDGMAHVVDVPRLVAHAGNKDDTLEAALANRVDQWLHELRHRRLAARLVRIVDGRRLVLDFKKDVSRKRLKPLV